MADQQVYLSSTVEQDMIALAREGLATRIRRAQNRRWRLEQAKQRLAELEALNARAIEKIGDPLEFERARREMLARQEQERRDFVQYHER